MVDEYTSALVSTLKEGHIGEITPSVILSSRSEGSKTGGTSTPPQSAIPPRQGSMASVQSLTSTAAQETSNSGNVQSQMNGSNNMADLQQEQSSLENHARVPNPGAGGEAKFQQSLQQVYGSLGQLKSGSRTSLPDIAEEFEGVDLAVGHSVMNNGSGSAPSYGSQTNLVKSNVGGSDDDLFGLEGSISSIQNASSTRNTTSTIESQFKQNSSNAIVQQQHEYGESRTLFISNVNPAIGDDALREYLMCFGDVHSLYTAAKSRGYVVVSYHDVRAATLAHHTLHGQTWEGRQLSCHQAPVGESSGTPTPPATILVASLDGGKSLDNVFYVLSTYGELRDLKSHPIHPGLCYAEYYDGRHAKAAVVGISSSPDLSTRLVAFEAGSASAMQLEADYFGCTNTGSSVASQQIAGSTAIDLSGMARSLSQMSLENAVVDSSLGGHSLSQSQAAVTGFSVGDLPSLSSTTQSSGYPLRGIASTGSIWQSATSLGQSPPVASSVWPTPQQRMHENMPLQPPHVTNSAIFQRQQQAAAAAAAAATLSQAQQQAAVQAAIQQALLASQNNNGNSLHMSSPSDMRGFQPGLGHIDLSGSNVGVIGGGLPRRGFSEPSLGGRLARRPMDPASEAERRAQQERLYGLDLTRIAAGEDRRTTLMIKNIPNKYTQKMLLTLLEERFSGVSPFPFDFFYLPIDFKNRCNVGYAFINMTSPFAIPKLVEEFHGRRWPKFNSEKICHISYARIQGRNALIQHFQNSSLLHEDKRCRPVLFTINGDTEAFPGLGPLQNLVGNAMGSNLSGSSGNLMFGGQGQ